jgi:hypothetical protein
MAFEAQHGPSGDGQDGHGLRVVLDLCGTDGGPDSGTVSGMVGLADGSFRRVFHGWIDLMSVISTLRAGAGVSRGRAEAGGEQHGAADGRPHAEADGRPRASG